MNIKKIIALVLAGLGLVCMLLTLVTLCSSASFVNEVEDEIGGIVKLNGGDVKNIISFLKITAEAAGYDDMSIIDIVTDEMDMYGFGFEIISLYARCWFFGFGILFFVAAFLLMAIAHEPKLPMMAWELIKGLGVAFVGSVTAMFAAMKAAPKAPKAKKASVHSCPACGAAYTSGTQYCASCGTKLPDPALIGICYSCGVKNDPAARFCANCGKPLQAAAPVVPPVAAEPVAPAAPVVEAENNNTQL